MAVPNINAAVLAYDGFDYTAGDVDGENGGNGWGAAWNSTSSPSAVNVVTGTLSYTGGSISVNGSGSALSIMGGTDGQLNRTFTSASSGNELYFSFLFQSVAGGGNEFSQFYLSNTADRFNAGGIGDLSTGSSVFGARANDGSADATSSSTIAFVAGTTYFLVGRLSTDGTTDAPANIIDRVELWVNPTSFTLGEADATANGSTGLTLADFDTFSVRPVGFSGTDEVLIDELRIGTDFASVIPEPSALGLILLGSLGLLARRRR